MGKKVQALSSGHVFLVAQASSQSPTYCRYSIMDFRLLNIIYLLNSNCYVLTHEGSVKSNGYYYISGAFYILYHLLSISLMRRGLVYQCVK